MLSNYLESACFGFFRVPKLFFKLSLSMAFLLSSSFSTRFYLMTDSWVQQHGPAWSMVAGGEWSGFHLTSAVVDSSFAISLF
jgi:hypothetical protein